MAGQEKQTHDIGAGCRVRRVKKCRESKKMETMSIMDHVNKEKGYLIMIQKRNQNNFTSQMVAEHVVFLFSTPSPPDTYLVLRRFCTSSLIRTMAIVSNF